MTTQPRLVNKQFNSPIGLYSQQNIDEVLQREQQLLANGAVGIDFHNPQTGKPANLQNSAVLRLLEEQENRRGGHPGNDDNYPRPLRDVSWPPPDHDQQNHLRSSFKDVVTPGAKRVAWPPPQEGILDPAEVVQQSPVQAQGGPQYSSRSPGLQQNSQAPQQQSYRPLKPLDVSSVGTVSPLGSPALNQSPQGFRSATPAKGWAPVQSPGTPLGPGAQKYFGATPTQQAGPQYPAQGGYQAPGAAYQQPAAQQYQAQPAYQQQPTQQQLYQPPQPSPYQQSQPAQPSPSQKQLPPQTQQTVAQTQTAAPRPQPAKQVEPPPSTITLRPAAPVSQSPNPVYSAQPATASLKVVVGGKHLRGDMKWPPENVRQRMADEERQLMELAQGPACRPTRKDKDYTPFFEAHALNSSYPGYKIPPGTQFYRPE